MSVPMTASAERALYHRDHAAWVKYSAPRLAGRIAAMRDMDVAFAWSLLTRETQRAVWEHLDETQRARIKVVRA